MFDVDYAKINIGEAEDDGTGFTRRRGFQYINSNTSKTASNMRIFESSVDSIRNSSSSLESDIEDMESEINDLNPLPDFLGLPGASNGVVLTFNVDPTAPLIFRGRAVGLNSDGLAFRITTTPELLASPIIGIAEANATVGTEGRVGVRVSGLTSYTVASGGTRFYLRPNGYTISSAPAPIFIGVTIPDRRLMVNIIIEEL